jgi:hypothetical protein
MRTNIPRHTLERELGMIRPDSWVHDAVNDHSADPFWIENLDHVLPDNGAIREAPD